jgi:hypothetical protein
MAAKARTYSVDKLHDFAENDSYETCEIKNSRGNATDVQSAAEALKHDSVWMGKGGYLYVSRSHLAGCHSSISSDYAAVNDKQI